MNNVATVVPEMKAVDEEPLAVGWARAKKDRRG
jgi:hypothetical protein